MFRVNGSLLLALPFPRPGPAERGSPTLPVLWRRYDFPPAHPRSLIGFASGAHAVLPRFVSRRGAPEPPEGAAQAGVRCSAGDPFPAAPHVDVSGISQVSWQSIPCLCPGLRPRPNRQPLALTVLSMLPPHPTRRRLRRLHDFEATAGLRHPLPTLHERRCRRPCKARFRLAGWPLPRGSRTLWIAMKGFRSSSRRPPFQDLACRKLDPCRAPDPQARLLHRPAVRRSAAPARLVWWFYADLKAYRHDPDPRRRTALGARFDRIFRRLTGFATLDRLSTGSTPTRTSCCVCWTARRSRCTPTARRAIAAARDQAQDLRRDPLRPGRECRDTFLSLLKTCAKLGVSFWDYLGHRLGVAQADVPYLPDLVRLRSATA